MAKIRIPTVNEKLLNKYIRHSIYLEQLKKAEANLISRFLGQKVFPKLSEKLISELGKIKNLETLGSINKIPARHLTRMMLAIRKTAQAGAVRAEKMLVKRLMNISRFEAQWNKNIIEKTVPFDLDMTMPSNEVLKNLVTMRPFDGHKLGTWMASYSTVVRVSMAKQIKIGIATGESLPNIGKRINKALNWKGKQAQHIARTAVSNVVHQAREEVFKKNKDIVRKVQWVSTLDDRTSIECIHLDGRMFDVGEGSRPPIHFNCRSSVIPITPSWQEYGVVDPSSATRASMNGAVPVKMNYRQWLKKQPKSVQVKVLGKKRAEFYRSGRVKIDRFVGKDLKPLNLKQLARREGISTKEFLPAPLMQVEAMPIKGIKKFMDEDKRRIWRFTHDGYRNINHAQLNKPLIKEGYSFSSKTEALKAATDMESTLKKLDGWEGISWRGIRFKSKAAKIKFLKDFKVGSVYESKSFQSTSKDFFAIEQRFTGKNGIKIKIHGKSGRDITVYSEFVKEKEVLFMKGTAFKVDKITTNSIHLTEITKQVQLRPAPPITVTKVGTTFAKTTTKEIQDLVNETIDAYPEKVKVALNRRGVSYNIGNSLTEINPVLKGKQPVGWSKGATWDNVGGVYNMSAKTVSVAETHIPIRGKFVVANSKNQIRRILNHETGHAFDNSAIGLDYSDRIGFKQAYKIDIAKLSKFDIVKNDLRFFMQKGMHGRSETFADIFGDIMGGGAKEGMSEFFPDCKKYIEDILK